MRTLASLSILVSSALLPLSAHAQDTGLSKNFSACMDKAGGVTVDMIECITTEYQHQDAQLNTAYTSLMNTLGADRKKQLKTAQRAWITYRDSNCDFYMDPDGGTLARVSANHCMMQMTANRAQEIEDLR